MDVTASGAAVPKSSLYILDTNTVGYIVNGRSPAARATLASAVEHSMVAISAITEAEILFGLARKPQAVRLRLAIEAFLATMSVLPWDSAAARAYATLRAQMTAEGRSLGNLDMLIAAQAVETEATLVTRDAAFAQVKSLRSLENWAVDV